MKRIGLLMLIALFAVGMSSCSIFKKCDCPKFNYLEEETEWAEEEIAGAEDACEPIEVSVE